MMRSHEKEMESNIEVLYSGASPEFFLGLAAKMLEDGEVKETPVEKPSEKKIDNGKDVLDRSRFQNRESHRDQKKRNI